MCRRNECTVGVCEKELVTLKWLNHNYKGSPTDEPYMLNANQQLGCFKSGQIITSVIRGVARVTKGSDRWPVGIISCGRRWV